MKETNNRAIKFFVDSERISVATETGNIVHGKDFARAGQQLYSSQHLSGYKRITLLFEGKRRKLMWHRVVAYAGFGERAFESGTVVHHKNHNRADNKLSNLEIVTFAQNMAKIEFTIDKAIAHLRKLGWLVFPPP